MPQDILGPVIRALVSVPTELLGMVKDFIHKITGKDGELWISQAKLFLQQKECWDKESMSKKVFINWLDVYRILDMEFRPSELEVPADPNFLDVYVMKGVTPNKVVEALRQLGVSVYTYVDNLDKDVSTNDRDPENWSYHVRFKANIEADRELANKSANDLKEENIQGITLLERLLLELGYFLATNEHLDVKNITLCSGSRNSDGFVPYVHCFAGGRKLCILWSYPQNRRGPLRARAVVS